MKSLGIQGSPMGSLGNPQEFNEILRNSKEFKEIPEEFKRNPKGIQRTPKGIQCIS